MPPVDHQFKKGQSGNPKGRPKKRKTFSEMLKAVLDVEVPVNGVLMSKGELVLTKAVNDAAKGVPDARKFVLHLMKNEEMLEDFTPNQDDLAMIEKYRNSLKGGSSDVAC